MFSIMLSVGNALFAWLIRSVLVKFVFYFALFFITTEFLALLVPYLPGASLISSAMAGIPAGGWWMIDLTRLDIGLPLVLSALVTRFMIRRIPIIG